jgi:hypothetical protein
MWVLVATSDSENPKRTQREESGEDPGETVIRHKFLEVLSLFFEDSITFLDDLVVIGSRFVLSFS